MADNLNRRSSPVTSRRMSPNSPEKVDIPEEILWGINYRSELQSRPPKPLIPTKSPLDLVLNLTRQKSKEKKSRCEFHLPSVPQPPDKKRRHLPPADTLLDRSVLNQKEYMQILSIPVIHPNPCKQHARKKRFVPRRRVCPEPCSPRLVQLSTPTKRLVYANWKNFGCIVSSDIVNRYYDLLHTNQNIELEQARFFFKRLDRSLRRQKRLKAKERRKKKKDKIRGEKKWLYDEIRQTADAIVGYIKDEPVPQLNYKQYLISNNICEFTSAATKMKKPLNRDTKSYYRRSIIEISDKLSCWVDAITKLVEVQPIDDSEDYSSSSVDIEYSTDESTPPEYLAGEGSDFDEDTLKRLIRIYGQSSPAALLSLVNESGQPVDVLEGLTHEDVLSKLQMMRQEIVEPKSPPDLTFLEGEDEYGPEIEYAVSAGPRHTLQLMENIASMGGPSAMMELEDFLSKNREEAASVLEESMVSVVSRTAPEELDTRLLDKMKEAGNVLAVEVIVEKFGSTYVEKDEFQGEALENELLRLLQAGLISEEEYRRALAGEMSPEELRRLKAMMGKTDSQLQMLKSQQDDSEAARLAEELARQEAEERARQLALAELEAQEQAARELAEREAMKRKRMEDDLAAYKARKAAEEAARRPKYCKCKPGHVGPCTCKEDMEEEAKKPVCPPCSLKASKRGQIEHSPNTLCCLSLKIWAVWLMEITQNAHNWTVWISTVIRKIRQYSAIVRGEVKTPCGATKSLCPHDWKSFTAEIDETILAWREYSAHVKDLTQKIIDKFHGRKVACCPRCLQDHLIRNVDAAHDTLASLTDALNCAAYWQRCLDEIIQDTAKLTCYNSPDSIEDNRLHDVHLPTCSPYKKNKKPDLYDFEEFR